MAIYVPCIYCDKETAIPFNPRKGDAIYMPITECAQCNKLFAGVVPVENPKRLILVSLDLELIDRGDFYEAARQLVEKFKDLMADSKAVTYMGLEGGHNLSITVVEASRELETIEDKETLSLWKLDLQLRKN